jgi:hypothetical protein
MKRILLASFILAFATTSIQAHHGLASEYDRDKVLTLKGKLREIDWRNPHPFLFMDVQESNGQITKWKNGAATPNMLVRYPGGWTRAKVFARLNEEVTIRGWQAKDGTNHIFGDYMIFSDDSKMQLSSGLGTV